MKIIYSLLVILSIISCNKDDVDPGAFSENDTSNFNPNTPEPVIDSVTPYIKATLNFVEWNAKQSENGFVQINANTKVIDSPNNSVVVDYLASFDQDLNNASFNNQVNTRIKIGFTGYNYSIADYSNTYSAFYSSFSIGSMAFYSSNLLNVEGAEVVYVDENNVTWTTRNGLQDGSTFNITKSKSLLNSANQPYQKVSGNFNCKLYKAINPQTNEYLLISNGEFLLNYDRP